MILLAGLRFAFPKHGFGGGRGFQLGTGTDQKHAFVAVHPTLAPCRGKIKIHHYTGGSVTKTRVRENTKRRYIQLSSTGINAIPTVGRCLQYMCVHGRRQKGIYLSGSVRQAVDLYWLVPSNN